MDRLNYHHLLYFFTVAREGSVARASRRLGLAQPTISAQIHTLEKQLGRKLLERSGRGLKVTTAGETVLRYAANIFALGGEMVAALDGEPAFAPALAAGVSSSLPQPLIANLIRASFAANSRQRLTTVQGTADALARQVAARTLQFAITDAPVTDGAARGLHSRVLLQSPVAVFAPAALARKLSRDFPSRLTGVSMAMSCEGGLRDEVERWLGRAKLAVQVAVEAANPEFYASAAGAAIFAPLLLREWLHTAHGLSAAGELKGLRWQAFLLTARSGAKLPAVEAILAAAKELS